MIRKISSSLSIFLIMGVLFSLVAVVAPVQQVQAADAPVILSPTSKITVAPGGPVTVTFTAAGSAAVHVKSGTTYDSFLTGTSPQTIYTGTNWPTGYYDVYVVDSNGSNTQPGVVYIDSTKPVVNMSVPSNCWDVTDNQTVNWTVSKNVSTVDVWLSNNSGIPTSYVLVQHYANVTSNTYTTSLKPSDFGITTTKYGKVYVVAVDAAGNQSDNSTSTSTSGLIYILSQDGLSASLGAVPSPLVGGNTQNINITVSTPGTAAYYLLALSKDGNTTSGHTENITSGWQACAPNVTFGYTWTVATDVNGSGCMVLLYAKDCAGNVVGTASNSFTIQPSTISVPVVVISYPSSGVHWYAGSTAADNITWTTTDNFTGNFSYQFYYATDNGTGTSGGWQPLVPTGSVPNTQGANLSVSWKPPSTLTAGTTYTIKIQATDSAGQIGYGYSPQFTIVQLTQAGINLALAQPNGGQLLTGGTAYSIQWGCQDSLDSTAPMEFDIYLVNSGGTSSQIAQLTNQPQTTTGSLSTYTWAVVNTVDQYKITVVAIDPAGNQKSITSTNFFNVQAGSDMQSFNIDLYPGLNFISLKAVPVSTDIQSVLANVMSNVKSVQYYSASTGWQTYVPAAGGGSLKTMKDGASYWVQMNGTPGSPSYPVNTPAYTLTFQGRTCAADTSGGPLYQYPVGVNMVGFKSTVAENVTSYLPTGTYGTQYLGIYGWNPKKQQQTSLMSTDQFTPGQGYYIYFGTAYGVYPGCN